LRENLIARLGRRQTLFPGIVGYEESVVPQIENAILSGQDVVFLGERGQAKTRLARLLVGLLDEAVPALAGCEINDDPFAPICQACRSRVAEQGDGAGIVWLTPDRRYGEKLATPDITIADLIGEVDPIKVAEGRYLSDELTIHYGLLPRTNRGIFAINELPDLAERIQVGLLNIMEERDVQIRGYKVRLPLDLFVVASANPEDYTNRGRIVTPLKDRYGSQIRTHYPRTIKEEIQIMEQERAHFPDEANLLVPQYMEEIIAEITAQARRSSDINQRSGVSVRVSIANLETLLSNAVRRAISQREQLVCPRISDLPYIQASFSGKIELETFEEGREGRVVEDLTKRAVLRVFGQYFEVSQLEQVIESFNQGQTILVSSEKPASEYMPLLRRVDGLAQAVRRLTDDQRPQVAASAVEFVLEGLHLNRRLNCERTTEGYTYHG
jgi:magnesium chelatase subunit I